MTLATFPTTPTLAWSVMKSPNWATRMQRSISGRELRVNDYVTPIYTFTLTYEVLRDRWDVRDGLPSHGAAYPRGYPVRDELRQIWNFFNQQHGAAVPFQFYDPTDNTTRTNPATPQVITMAVGDGITTQFPFVSAIGAPVIPVSYLLTPTGSAIDFDTGIITFPHPLAMGVPLTADMTYNYKVRFATDNLEAENFMYQLWSMKTLKLTSVLF